jgi:peptidoglycan L-alanyl-D-glutamate endopeptidase CwlK
VSFNISARSRERLQGVNRDLVRVVEQAIQITTIDFGVTQGLRTIEQQRKYVASGASATMDSRHLTGHAVDVAAYIGRELRWDFGLYYHIAGAFRQAAKIQAVPIRWGGCWMRLDTTSEPLPAMVARYTESARSQGRRPLIDGPHFELPKALYP